jgi:hypothetical protein
MSSTYFDINCTPNELTQIQACLPRFPSYYSQFLNTPQTLQTFSAIFHASYQNTCSWKWNPFYFDIQDPNVANFQVLVDAFGLRCEIFSRVSEATLNNDFSLVITKLQEKYEATSLEFKMLLAHAPLFVFKLLVDCYQSAVLISATNIETRKQFLYQLIRFVCEIVARRSLQIPDQPFYPLTSYNSLRNYDYIKELLDSIEYNKHLKFMRLTTEILFFVGHDTNNSNYNDVNLKLDVLLSTMFRCLGGPYSYQGSQSQMSVITEDQGGQDEDGKILNTMWLHTQFLLLSLMCLCNKSKEDSLHQLQLLHLQQIYKLFYLYEVGTNMLIHAAIFTDNSWLLSQLQVSDFNEFFKASILPADVISARRDLIMVEHNPSHTEYCWWYSGANKEESLIFMFLLYY